MSKSPVKLRTRQAVYQRDGGVCHYCGAGDSWTLDHKNPSVLGGTHDEGNLVCACKSCNSAKEARGLDAYRSLLQFRKTKYHGVITVGQYWVLQSLGANLDPLPEHTFHFEGGAK